MRSVLYIAAAAAAKQPPLWPLPQNYSCSTQKLTLIPSPAFFRVDAGNDVLAAAAKRKAAEPAEGARRSTRSRR